MTDKGRNGSHSKSQGLISLNKIKPEIWRLSEIYIPVQTGKI